MKKIIFKLLISMASIYSYAQTINTEWATEINETFAGIDKNKIPYGLLKDYAMEFTDLSVYNGFLTDSSYVSKGTLKSIYNTLVMARVKSNIKSLLSPKVFDRNWKKIRRKNAIVLSRLYFKYSQFKSNTFPNYISLLIIKFMINM
ncbi:hypothetical protein [Psychroflexus tropicus]|uniref:hypothetical protein n=1 Tax=Psychroflexus tropicus TaxID=197345 RepID=UPI0003A2D44B|nr:hypothetical protein [Psychroflexus tropicus]